jgi:hypothetical protein
LITVHSTVEPVLMNPCPLHAFWPLHSFFAPLQALCPLQALAPAHLTWAEAEAATKVLAAKAATAAVSMLFLFMGFLPVVTGPTA